MQLATRTIRDESQSCCGYSAVARAGGKKRMRADEVDPALSKDHRCASVLLPSSSHGGKLALLFFFLCARPPPDMVVGSCAAQPTAPRHPTAATHVSRE
jgi:hypothetical protein